MKNMRIDYKIIINGDLMKTYYEPLFGLAKLAFDSACYNKDLNVVLERKIIDEEDFDPVLHGTKTKILYNRPAITPCYHKNISSNKKCPYLKNAERDFINTPRPTALRVEAIAPSNRCGFLLKPTKLGGHFFDYDYCVKS